jgi:hypothetical protein
MAAKLASINRVSDPPEEQEVLTQSRREALEQMQIQDICNWRRYGKFIFFPVPPDYATKKPLSKLVWLGGF